MESHEVPLLGYREAAHRFQFHFHCARCDSLLFNGSPLFAAGNWYSPFNAFALVSSSSRSSSSANVPDQPAAALQDVKQQPETEALSETRGRLKGRPPRGGR